MRAFFRPLLKPQNEGMAETDNDSVFMNETVQSYCKEAGVEFTRCRPYRKKDQAWVEQKNGSCAPHCGLPTLRGPGGGSGVGSIVYVGSFICEFLSAGPPQVWGGRAGAVFSRLLSDRG